MQAAVSRQREYLADATGALTTRHPEALASALEKLKAYGRPVARDQHEHVAPVDQRPEQAGSRGPPVQTHPPIDDRVARLRDNATKF